MGFLQAKADLALMEDFQSKVLFVLHAERGIIKRLSSVGHPSATDLKTRAAKVASGDPEYVACRKVVSENVGRAIEIARTHHVPVDIESHPPAMIGGAPIVPLNLFRVVLADNSWGGVEDQMIVDLLNEVVGDCRNHKAQEFFRLFNPFSWCKRGLFAILRIPFVLVEATGFNISKVEDHFLAKLFKLIEVAVLLILLWKLGASNEQLQEIIRGLMGGEGA